MERNTTTEKAKQEATGSDNKKASPSLRQGNAKRVDKGTERAKTGRKKRGKARPSEPPDRKNENPPKPNPVSADLDLDLYERFLNLLCYT
jgi:hypothetical protein